MNEEGRPGGGTTEATNVPAEDENESSGSTDGPRLTDLRDYLDTFYGYEGAYGYLHFAIADPYLNDKGQLKQRNWTPVSFEWPVGALHERDFLRAILSDALEHDVFLGPYLMSERRRGKSCIRALILVLAWTAPTVHGTRADFVVSSRQIGLPA